MISIILFNVITTTLTITITVITATTIAETTSTSSHINLHSVPTIASIYPLYLNCYDDGKNSTGPSEDSGLRFHLPAVDTIIHHQRGQGLHILQEPRKQWLFLLNGPELYRVAIFGQQTTFLLVGLLDEAMWKTEHVGAEIISWHDYFILVVAFEKNLVIYQMEDDITTSAAALISPSQQPEQRAVPTYPTIQQLAISRRYRKIFLFTPIVKKLMLILAMDGGDAEGSLKTFEWTHTYFSAVEEVRVPGVDVLSQQENYFIAGRTAQDGNTTMSVYKVERQPMKLSFIQTLTVDSRRPHFFYYRERNCIIACTDDESSCKIFRMIDGRYNFHRDSTSKRLVFSKFLVGHKFQVGERGNKITVVANARVNCNSSFISDYEDVSAIAIHINQNGETFVVLVYVGPAETVLRAVEIEDISGEVLGKVRQDDPEQMDLQTRREHIFEYTVGQLRSILLKRNAAMVLFRQIPKWKSLNVKNPITIRAGKIDVVHIVGSDLRSPVQLVNHALQLARHHGSRWRSRRSTHANEKLTESETTLLRLHRLRVDKLVYHRNILEDFHLDATAKPMPILSVRSPLTTKLVHTPELLTPQKFRAVRQSSLGLFDLAAEPVVATRHLNVRSINNVPWSEFYDSLFLTNRVEAVEGRLVLQAETTVHELKASRVNGLVVNSLFNLVQPQEISSSILFSGLKVLSLHADLINGLDFAKDIVFRGTNDTVETPVVMHKLSISGAAFLVNHTKAKRSITKGFQQTYAARVVVKGTVSVRNLFPERAGKVLVGGQPLALDDLEQTYFLNRSEQTFTTPIKIGHSRLIAPSLNTSFLNGHPTEKHLLNTGRKVGAEDPSKLQAPLYLIFMSAKIGLDLINTEYGSHLANLSKSAVRRGDVADITGIKTFQAPVSVNNLVAHGLSGIPADDLVLKSDLRGTLQLVGTKYFDRIKVANAAHVAQDLKARHLNSVSLTELLNRDYHLDQLSLPHRLLATNLVFHALNGISFEPLFMNLELKSDRSLVMRKNLIVEGSAQFRGNLEVDTVNGLNWTQYRQSLVDQQGHVVIDGGKHFVRELLITGELRARVINSLNVTEIFTNTLSKSRPQVVTGSYRFGELRVNNMELTVINQVPTAAFIDSYAPEVIIEGDVVVPAISVHGNMIAPLGDQRGEYNWNTLAERLRQLPNSPWRNVYVLGNARWGEMGEKGPAHSHTLAYLRNNAVRITGHQVITGNVHLTRPIISNMTTANSFPTELDFDLLVKDGLFRGTTKEQLVVAPKSFINSLHADSIEAVSEVSCNKLNGIDVLLLNASLYRRSSGEPLLGPLHFEQVPLIGYLAVRGTVNGLDSGQIYHRLETSLPPLKATQLHVGGGLQIQDINDMSMEYFLSNRVTKNGEALEVFGTLEFESLVLNKEIILQSINGVPINSLVLKVSERLQAITGDKIIDGDLVLAGPVHVMRLNEKHLIDYYQASIFTNFNYHFDHLTVEEAIFEQGIRESKELLLAPESVIAQRSPPEEDEFTSRSLNNNSVDGISQKLAIIDGMQKKSRRQALPKKHTKRLLYLDYDFDTRVIWREGNETVNVDNETSYIIGTQSLSLLCTRQTLRVMKSALHEHLLFVSNTTSNSLAVELQGWSVQAENYCNSEFRRLRSKITISNSRVSKIIGLPKIVEQLELFETSDEPQACVLLVHAVDALANRDEVHLLRLDGDEIAEAQLITHGIGRVLRFFQPTRNHSLLVSSALVHNRPMVSVYIRSSNTQHFVLRQIIEGDYDLFEYVQVAVRRFHLMLGCVQGRRVAVYAFDAQRTSFDNFQLIELSHPLAKMLPLNFGDDSRYLLILPTEEQNFYHLYKFSHIQGWLPLTYGYFDNIRLAVPLLAEGNLLKDPSKSLQLLLCSNHACSVVKAHLQGAS